MRFLVLGPLEVSGEDGEPSKISGSKERMILACLIARAGRVVSVDDFIDELWGERPPRTAEQTLGSYVSRLRRALDPRRAVGSTSEIIASRGGGYVLEVDGHEIDALRFEQLAAEGRQLIDAARMEDAGAALEEALGLWRGNAFQEFRYSNFGGSEAERLAELRRAAVEDLIDTRLALGDAGTLIADLEAMVRDEPLRERRWAQLMLALHRAGRQAEALQAFTRARTILVDEVGIEPGSELQRLQTAILAQDPELERRPTPAEPARSTDLCPYKGLARFDTTDAEFFFGREQMIAEGVGRLVGGRFIAFVGASGSGKSSVMRAGLLHALASGVLPGSDRWAYAVMRPGNHPLVSMNRAIEAAQGAGRSILAVDQFEETFTASADDAERTAFLDALTDAALTPDGAVTVVLAMRADYYGRCAEHRALATLLASSQILVGPMNEDELRRAIELPAERADLIVEQELTDALVRDSVGQPGGLPLLSTALLELWTRRRDRTLGIEDYLRTGGVEGAVARLAEDAFSRLDVDGQASAKRILLRLALSGEGAEVVRRRASLAEFDLERDASASRALAVLTDARLVTVAEGTAEVAHEALLRDWPRLRAWLEDNAEGRNLHRHVTDSAFAWEEGGRDEGDLYRGARLTAALDWAEAHESDPNDLESAFLRRSRSASEGEAVRARRTNRLLRTLLGGGVALLLALSLVVGSLALRQRDQAQAVATVADARQLAASSLTQKDVIVSLLLAREAVALDDSPQTRSALLSALQREPAAIATMHANGAAPGDLTEWLQLSPDGQVIATGGARTTVDFFDATTYRSLGAIDVGARTTTGDFSSDGGTLVVAAADQQIIGIDMNARTVRTSVTTEGREVDAVLFAPTGDRLLTAESIRERGFLIPRDPVTLEPSGAGVPLENGPITAMAFSTDSHRLVTTGIPPDATRPGGHTALWKWNTHDLEQVGDAFPIGGNDVALSPDGYTAAIAASESGNNNTDDLKGHLVLLDLRTGRWQRSVEGSTPGLGGGFGLTGVTFSSDGSVISTGDDHRVLFWTSLTTLEEGFDDPAGLEVFSPMLSPDGATLFTVDVDGNLVAWDLKGDRRIGRSFTAGSDATYANGSWFVISPNGKTLAIAQVSPHGQSGWVRLVDASTLEGIGVIPLDGNSYSLLGLAFSPDSRTLAVSSFDGYVQLWEVSTRTPEGPPFRAPGKDLLWVAAFSPDGSMLATAGLTDSQEGVVFLWDVSTGQLTGQLPKLEGAVSALNFSPDGTLLVVSTGYVGGGDVIVWNVVRSERERTIPADGSGVFSADLSNDGTTLVTGGESRRETLWDLSTGRRIGPAFTGPTTTVDLSPDGRTLAAAGYGEAAMWDVATRTVLGRSFTPVVGPKDNLTAAFTPDGARLFILSETGEGWVWNVDPISWESRACQIAGRSMTQAEWSLYLPDRPYQATCGS